MVSNAAFLLCCVPTIGFGSALACLGEIEGFTRIDSPRETREGAGRGGGADKATCPQWNWDTAQLIGACKMIRATWAYQCQAQEKERGRANRGRGRESDLLWIVNIKNITKAQRASTGPVKWNITTHQILACTNKHVPVCVCTFSFHSFLVANALWLMSILFANISLSSSSPFVVISVYCFLYIFQLERTKSYSKCQSSYLAKPCHSYSHLSLLPVGAFVCVMSLFCALPWRVETRNCRVNMFYIHFPDWWLPLRVGNGIACGRGRALHMRTFCLYFSILQSGNVSITCAQIELSRVISLYEYAV